MNAKPILLAILCGFALGGTVAFAQDKVSSSQLDVLSQRIADAVSGGAYDCRLTYKEGGQKTPVRVKAADPSEAQRNAIALATPTGADCTQVGSDKVE